MAAPPGYTTLQVHRTTLAEIQWVADQLGLPYGKGLVVEDLIRWTMTPEGLSAFRKWKAEEILKGGPILSGPKS